jgi:hypothetical protein
MKAKPIVFGGFDGVTSMLGLGLGMTISHQPHTAIWAAAVSTGMASFSGMAGGQYESAPEDGRGAAVACGVATVAGTLAPGVPYLLWSGWVALGWATLVTAALGGLIVWLRPERGWRAIAKTGVLLAGAAVLSFAGGLLVEWHLL